MNIIVRDPPAPLRLFVNKLWYISADHFDHQDIGLPILQHEFMFNFSEHFSICQSDNRALIDDQETWITGLYTRPQRSITRGRHETFGVFLKPWALQSLTNVPASELTNQVVESGFIFHQPIREITHQLREINDVHTKLSFLEEFLVKQFTGKDIPAYIPYAVDYLQKHPWYDGIIRQLSGALKISPKSLNQAFKKYIGLPPGQFLQLHRLNEVATDLAQNPHQSLTELAYRHNFFDQAHLNHLFNSLTNLTPGDYRKQVLAGNVAQTVPCFIHQPG